MKNPIENIEKTVDLLKICANIYDNKEKMSFVEQRTTLKDILMLSTYCSPDFLNVLRTTFNQNDWPVLSEIIHSANMEAHKVPAVISVKDMPNRVLALMKKMEKEDDLGVFPYVLTKLLSRTSDKNIDSDYKEAIVNVLKSDNSLTLSQRGFLENQNKMGSSYYHFKNINISKDMKYFEILTKMDEENIKEFIENKEKIEKLEKEIAEVQKNNGTKSFYGTINTSKVYRGGKIEEDLEGTHSITYATKAGQPVLRFMVSEANEEFAKYQAELALKESFPQYLGLVELSKVVSLEKFEGLIYGGLNSLNRGMVNDYESEVIVESKEEKVVNKKSKNKVQKEPDHFMENILIDLGFGEPELKSKVKVEYNSKDNIQVRLYAAIKNNDYETLQVLMLEDKDRSHIDLSKDDGMAFKLAKEQQEKTGFSSSLSFLNKYIDNQNNPTEIPKHIKLHNPNLVKEDLKSYWELVLVGEYNKKDSSDLYTVFEKFSKDNNLTKEEVELLSNDLPSHKGQVTVKYYVDNLKPWLKPESKEAQQKKKNKP